MPFDGSGNFTRAMNWVADATAGIKILATRHDTEDDNFKNGLSNTICKDGQSSPTADIPFNAKKITGLADPVNDQDAVTKKYMLGAATTQGLFTKVGFASADMSLLGRAAGAPAGTLQRIAYNDKADGTGNDVFVVNDDGTVSARAADGTYKVYAPATAQARNRIVNGAMQISQENGNTAGTTIGYYIADQWYISFTTTGTPTVQRVQSVTPNGSVNRLRLTVTVADTSLAATEQVSIVTRIEGIRTADFRWGSASAKQIIVRFGFKGPAGTYNCRLTNVVDRTYIANFTISAGQANTDTEQIFIIPGDTAGTWPTDTSTSILLSVTIAGGSNFIGVAGWQAGTGPLATSANTNGMATGGAVFELFDVGLYLDPQATGVAPAWTMPDEAEELLACQRYFVNLLAGIVTNGMGYGYIATTTSARVRLMTFAPMRAIPSLSTPVAMIFMSSAGANATGYTLGLSPGGFVDLNATVAGATTGCCNAVSASYVYLNARM